MASRDKELARQLRQLLDPRPGWSLQPQATPGLPAMWCFGPGGRARLGAGVDAGELSVYLEDLDRDLRFADVTGLAAWLDANESLFAGPHAPGAEDFDLLLRRRFEEWRHAAT
jgi:hypothetical protein